jgi:hypothetical protein
MNKIIKYLKNMNLNGMYIPTVSDPITQRGSITAFLVFISCICVIISLFYPKMSSSSALDFYLVSLGAYLGRKLMSKNNAVLENNEEKNT